MTKARTLGNFVSAGNPLADGSPAVTNSSNSFTSSQTVSVTDNSNSAVRITQLGTGNALLVEDAANPDSTPTVIDASGRVIIGKTSTIGLNEQLQSVLGSGSTANGGFYKSASSDTPQVVLYRSLGTVASPTAVTTGNTSLGQYRFGGYVTDSFSSSGWNATGAYIEGVYTSTGTYGEIGSSLSLVATHSGGQVGTATVEVTSLGYGALFTTDQFVLRNSYKEGVRTANTSTAFTIDISSYGTIQILTLTGNCTFTFPTAVAGQSFTILLKQDATGSRTVTWPSSVKWPSGTAPTITSTALKLDKYIFTADGTNWYGSNAGQNYTV